MRNFVFLIIMMTVLIPSCQEQKTKNTPIENKVEEKKEIKKVYAIEGPAGWERFTKEMGGKNVLFFSSPLEEAGDTFRENINVIVESTSQLPLDQYVDLSITNMRQLNQFVNERLSVDSFNGRLYKVLDYKHASGINNIEATAYFTVEGDSAYIITCTAKEGKRAQLTDQFKTVVSSFHIKNE